MPGSSQTKLAIPPLDLLMRIGPMGDEDPVGTFERSGLAHRRLLDEVLPDDWVWPDKTVLDFGCGIGRVVRQFSAEAASAEFWGCDLDEPSVEWLAENLSPPFNFFATTDAPGLPQDDGVFDLIYAFSVYTHLTDNWAGWLLEHHRVLKPGGLLFVTFLGEGMTESQIGEAWDEDRIGLNTLMHGNPWDLGGPIAFASPWWIRAHWGRAFEIVDLRPRLGNGTEPAHGCVLMRKKDVELTEDELMRPEPDEPREIQALLHQVEQHRDETLSMRGHLVEQQQVIEGLEAELRQERELRADLLGSASWRLTAPLRSAKGRLRPKKP